MRNEEENKKQENKKIREKKRWQQISIHRQRSLFLKPII